MAKDRMPTGDYNLSFRAWHETDSAIKRIVATAIGDRRVRFGAKRPHQSVLVNALILWFDTLEGEDQLAALAEGMVICNRLADEAEGVEEETKPPAPIPKVEVRRQVEPKKSAADTKKRTNGGRRWPRRGSGCGTTHRLPLCPRRVSARAWGDPTGGERGASAPAACSFGLSRGGDYSRPSVAVRNRSLLYVDGWAVTKRGRFCAIPAVPTSPIHVSNHVDSIGSRCTDESTLLSGFAYFSYLDSKGPPCPRQPLYAGTLRDASVC